MCPGQVAGGAWGVVGALVGLHVVACWVVVQAREWAASTGTRTRATLPSNQQHSCFPFQVSGYWPPQ